MPRQSDPPSTPGQRAAPGGVAAVDRALSLLHAFTVDRPLLTLSELSETTQQYKSTVLRLMASLAHAHIVRRQDDGRFALGSAVARLHAVYTASFSLGDLVVPALEELVGLTQESAAFHVRQGDKDLCLYRVDSPHPVRDHLRAGDLRPLTTGASGLVLGAYTGKGGARAARIRKRQVLVANGDLEPELTAIAAPVFGPGIGFAGVVALTMPSIRMLRAYEAEVLRTARQLSAELGGSYPTGSDAPAARRRSPGATAPVRPSGGSLR